MALRYLPTLQSLEKEYRAKGVQFVSLNAAEVDSLIDMATQSVRHEIEFPFVKDFNGDCAKALGVDCRAFDGVSFEYAVRKPAKRPKKRGK